MKELDNKLLTGLSLFSQILDSSFPSGSFVYSYGLEPTVLANEEFGANELEAFLRNMLTHQFAKNEFYLARKAHQAFCENKLQAVLKWEEEYVCAQSYEYAKSALRIGKIYAKHAQPYLLSGTAKIYGEYCEQNDGFGSELFVLLCLATQLELPSALFLTLWGKKVLVAIAMCATKITTIKPTQIQQILFALDKELQITLATEVHSMSYFNPHYEHIIAQHPTLSPKLFIT